MFFFYQMLPIRNSKVLLEAKYVAWDVSVFYRDSYLTCHTINTISSSYLAFLALWDPDPSLSPKSFEEASLSTAEGWQREGAIQTRQNNSQIPVAQ